MKKQKWLVVMLIVVLALAMFLAACTDKDETPDEQQNQTVTPGDNTGTDPGSNPGTTPAPTAEEIKAAQKSAVSNAINNLINSNSFAKNYIDRLNKDNVDKKDQAINNVADKLVDAGFSVDAISSIINNVNSLRKDDIAYTEENADAPEMIIDFDNLPFELPTEGKLADFIDKYDTNVLLQKSFIEYVQAYAEAFAEEESFDAACDTAEAIIDTIPVDSVKNLISMFLSDTAKDSEDLDEATVNEFVESDACETAITELLATAKSILAKEGGKREEMKSILASLSNTLALALADEEVAASGADGVDENADEDEDEPIEINIAEIVVAIAEGLNYEAINNAGDIICTIVDTLRASEEFEPALLELKAIFSESEEEAEEETIDFDSILVGVKFVGLTLKTLEKDDTVKLAGSLSDAIGMATQMFSAYMSSNNEPTADNAPGDADEDTNDDETNTPDEESQGINPFMLLSAFSSYIDAPVKYLGDILYKAYVALGETDQAVLEELFQSFAPIAVSEDEPAETTTPLGDLLTFLHSKSLPEKGLTDEEIEALDPELYFAPGDVIAYVFAFFGLGGNTNYEPDPIEIVGYELVLDTSVLAGEPLKGSLRIYGKFGTSELVEEKNEVTFEDEDADNAPDNENNDGTDTIDEDVDADDDDDYLDYDISLDVAFTIEKDDEGKAILVLDEDPLPVYLVTLYGQDYFTASKFSLEANDFDNDVPGNYTITISFDDEEFPAEEEFEVTVINNLNKYFDQIGANPTRVAEGMGSFDVVLSFTNTETEPETVKTISIIVTPTEEYDEFLEENLVSYPITFPDQYVIDEWFAENGFEIEDTDFHVTSFIGPELNLNAEGQYLVVIELEKYEVEFYVPVEVYYVK